MALEVLVGLDLAEGEAVAIGGDRDRSWLRIVSGVLSLHGGAHSTEMRRTRQK